jgi:hypothetical protein
MSLVYRTVTDDTGLGQVYIVPEEHPVELTRQGLRVNLPVVPDIPHAAQVELRNLLIERDVMSFEAVKKRPTATLGIARLVVERHGLSTNARHLSNTLVRLFKQEENTWVI